MMTQAELERLFAKYQAEMKVAQRRWDAYYRRHAS